MLMSPQVIHLKKSCQKTDCINNYGPEGVGKLLCRQEVALALPTSSPQSGWLPSPQAVKVVVYPGKLQYHYL